MGTGDEVLEGCSPLCALEILCANQSVNAELLGYINRPRGFPLSGCFFLCSPVVQLELQKK